jgi:hypothetical protein
MFRTHTSDPAIAGGEEMHGSGMTKQREADEVRQSDSRVVVLDITSRLRRSDGAPRIRGSRKPALGLRALWELRRVFEMRRRIEREIAARRARIGARSAARRAARRRELMAWACCPDDELPLVLALEEGVGYDDSPARRAPGAEVSSGTIVKTFPIHRIVRSDPGYSPGGSCSGDAAYSVTR